MLPVLTVLLMTGAWTGAIVFQSALVAPAVFGELDMADARSVLRRLFPRFFALGIGLTLLALVAAPFLPTAVSVRNWTIAILVAMLVAIGISLALVPAINRASDAGERRRFAALHGASVLMTLLNLAGAIAVIALLAADRA